MHGFIADFVRKTGDKPYPISDKMDSIVSKCLVPLSLREIL
jgi:hypothetical protein